MLQIFILSPKLLLRNLATSMLQVTLSSLQALLYRSAFVSECFFSLGVDIVSEPTDPCANNTLDLLRLHVLIVAMMNGVN